MALDVVTHGEIRELDVTKEMREPRRIVQDVDVRPGRIEGLGQDAYRGATELVEEETVGVGQELNEGGTPFQDGILDESLDENTLLFGAVLGMWPRGHRRAQDRRHQERVLRNDDCSGGERNG